MKQFRINQKYFKTLALGAVVLTIFYVLSLFVRKAPYLVGLEYVIFVDLSLYFIKLASVAIISFVLYLISKLQAEGLMTIFFTNVILWFLTILLIYFTLGTVLYAFASLSLSYGSEPNFLYTALKDFGINMDKVCPIEMETGGDFLLDIIFFETYCF